MFGDSASGALAAQGHVAHAEEIRVCGFDVAFAALLAREAYAVRTGVMSIGVGAGENVAAVGGGFEKAAFVAEEDVGSAGEEGGIFVADGGRLSDIFPVLVLVLALIWTTSFPSQRW